MFSAESQCAQAALLRVLWSSHSCPQAVLTRGSLSALQLPLLSSDLSAFLRPSIFSSAYGTHPIRVPFSKHTSIYFCHDHLLSVPRPHCNRCSSGPPYKCYFLLLDVFLLALLWRALFPVFRFQLNKHSQERDPGHLDRVGACLCPLTTWLSSLYTSQQILKHASCGHLHSFKLSKVGYMR